MRSVGVEEELLLVDPNSGEPVAVSGAALAAADRRTWQHGGDGAKDHQFEGELQQEQMEFATEPVTEMGGSRRRSPAVAGRRRVMRIPPVRGWWPWRLRRWLSSRR